MDEIKGNTSQSSKPWSWVPTLYFAEGLPYVIVTALALIMYKKLGFSNWQASLYTSWLYLPWGLKPFWSPVIEMFKTKRWWILSTQMMTGVCLGAIGLSIETDYFTQISLITFWLVAFNSATHDIAADGFYLSALNSHEQSFFVGIRNTAYRISTIVGQGFLIYLAGMLEEKLGISKAWGLTLFISSAAMMLLGLYHYKFLSKNVKTPVKANHGVSAMTLFLRTFRKFFQKKEIVTALSFILLFRLGEAQLCRISPLFMLDEVEKGGLGLSTEQLGLINGTGGVIALTLGGILGGMAVSKNGLKSWLWPMVCSMNLPNLVYVFMSATQPDNIAIITTMVCIEQFGYGFGLTSFMMYLIYFSKGDNKTSNYAICTGFMSLGMMIPGMFAGGIQEEIGYNFFFIYVCICTIPGFIMTKLLKIDDNFGKKEEETTKKI